MLSYAIDLAQRAWDYVVSVYNYAKSVYNWARAEIVNAANWAITQAKDYAYARYLDFIRTIRDVRHTIDQNIQYYYNLAISFINDRLAPLWQQFQTIVGLIGQRISEAFHAWIDPIWQALQPVRDFVNGYWQRIIDGLNWIWQTGLNLPGQLAALWSTVQNTVIPNINKFIQDTVPTLATVVTNPWGFVYPYLKDYLLELLFNLLAQGMGTTKYTLPPFPTFNFGGTGGAYTYEDSARIDNSELHKPLSSLYISGYRFGPGHPGLDLGLTNGQPIFAMHDGVVDIAGWSDVGYGYQVVIRGSNWWSRYAHCQSLGVRPQDTVRAGQVIALGDSTGNSTGPHLHLEIKYKGNFVDPVSVLPV